MRVAPELSTIFGIITIFFFFLSLENFRPPLLSLPVRPYSVHAKYGAGKARRRAESRDRVNWEFQRANHVDATCAHDAPGRPALPELGSIGNSQGIEKTRVTMPTVKMGCWAESHRKRIMARSHFSPKMDRPFDATFSGHTIPDISLHKGWSRKLAARVPWARDDFFLAFIFRLSPFSKVKRNWHTTVKTRALGAWVEQERSFTDGTRERAPCTWKTVAIKAGSLAD